MHELSMACAHLTLVGGEFHQAWVYAGVELPGGLLGLLSQCMGEPRWGRPYTHRQGHSPVQLRRAGKEHSRRRKRRREPEKEEMGEHSSRAGD